MSHHAQYAPFQSSRLASSPSTRPTAGSVAPSSDLPSSPTTASFYTRTPAREASSISRTTTRPRLYKSHSSSRTSTAREQLHRSSSPSTTSTTTNPFRAIHEAARLERLKQARPRRDLVPTLTSAVIPDEPGGWTPDGEWEEFDELEKERLELEMLDEKKRWKSNLRLKQEQAEDAMLDPEDEFDLDEEEPPPDVLSEYEPPLPSPLDPTTVTTLPSLASSISSSPLLAPSSLLLESDVSMSQHVLPDPVRTRNSILAFEAALIATPCPACTARDTIRGDETGARCTTCGWGIQAETLGPLELAFAQHGDAESGHVPVFSYTPFTDTLVLCQACEEQFAA
ncbi:uncharacterized protein JCM15063_006502 [Sporobolomyces koalae]|uniref:uncharacterized protein n=1 Tax=Sporobolomyces koalae TaxID=500713 RepID=UPI00317C5033